MDRAYSRNLGQHSVLARKGTFYEETALFFKKRHFKKKKAPECLPLFSIPFLSVFHQNKGLHNLQQKVQHLIVEHNIDLEYALIAVFLSNIYPNLKISFLLK